MMVEMVRARKPLGDPRSADLAASARSTSAPAALTRRLFAADRGPWRRVLAGAAASRRTCSSATRDFRAFHRMLLDHGLAVRAGEPLRPPRGAVPDDLPVVVARIRALMGIPEGTDR